MTPKMKFRPWYAELISLSLQAGSPYLIKPAHHHRDSWAADWSPYREWNRLVEADDVR